MALPLQLAIALRWLPVLILGTVLSGVTALVFTSLQPRVYEVSATLLPAQLRLAGNPDFNTVSVSRLVGLATNYAFTAKSQQLLTDVGRRLAITDSLVMLSKRVDATVDVNTAVLKITARAGTEKGAAALANAVANEIEDQSAAAPNDDSALAELDVVRQRILETEAEYQRLLALPPPRTVEDTQALGDSLSLLRELTNLYATLDGSLNRTPSGLIVVDSASAQLAQMIEPRMLFYTLLAAMAGLLISAGLVSILEYLDDTVKSSQDVEEVTGLRTLGTVSHRPTLDGTRALPTLYDPTSAAAEAYRTLRTNIEFASTDAPIRTLLVSSSNPGEGKSMIAANLAVAFAQAGRSVVLVDADLRTPGLHLMFDMPNTHGLTTLLRSDALGLGASAQGTEQANLRVLTTGALPPNPAELLGAQRMRTVIDRLQGEVDLIIVDGPPLKAVSDSLVLSSFLDATLFVIAAGRSRRAAVRLASESFTLAQASVVGAVLCSEARGRFPHYGDDVRVPREVPILVARAGERASLS